MLQKKPAKPDMRALRDSKELQDKYTAELEWTLQPGFGNPDQVEKLIVNGMHGALKKVCLPVKNNDLEWYNNVLRVRVEE